MTMEARSRLSLFCDAFKYLLGSGFFRQVRLKPDLQISV
jgi:hypothetical protein